MTASARKKIADEHVGRKVIKKRGFFSGLIGIIVKSDSRITDYVIEFGSGSRVGVVYIDDVEFL